MVANCMTPGFADGQIQLPMGLCGSNLMAISGPIMAVSTLGSLR